MPNSPVCVSLAEREVAQTYSFLRFLVQLQLWKARASGISALLLPGAHHGPIFLGLAPPSSQSRCFHILTVSLETTTNPKALQATLQAQGVIWDPQLKTWTYRGSRRCCVHGATLGGRFAKPFQELSPRPAPSI